MESLNIKNIVKESIYRLFEDDNSDVTEGDLESEGVELTKDCVLGFSKGNGKLEWPYFSLPSGYSCPFATICKNMPARWEGPIKGGSFKRPSSWDKNIKPGPKAKFMCYAARAQGQYPGANIQAFSNLNLLKKLKTPNEMADLIIRSMGYHKITNTDILRVHEAGDFFSQTYFDAWMETARRLPNTLFYAYTTSLPFWSARSGSIPANFKLIASMDEENEQYIHNNNLRYSKVVNSEEEAEELGLNIDYDDSIAFGRTENFALLLHGPQPKGSEAAQALKQNKLDGVYDKLKHNKELNQDVKDDLRDKIKRELRGESYIKESEEDDGLDWIREINPKIYLNEGTMYFFEPPLKKNEFIYLADRITNSPYVSNHIRKRFDDPTNQIIYFVTQQDDSDDIYGWCSETPYYTAFRDYYSEFNLVDARSEFSI